MDQKDNMPLNDYRPSSVVGRPSSVIGRPSSVLILLLPIAYLAWSLFLNHLAGPFFLSRSDPEYPYLLNGLNCITLNFNMIGHTDHPGTPFQVLTGIFIGIIYLFAGQGTIVEDVISRPEMYLSFSSLFLSVTTFLILIWLGWVAIRNNKDLAGAIILQSSLLLSSVLVDFPMRYNPDRMLSLYALVFAGISYEYLFAKKMSGLWFAILSGILMGVGFATKFNFLPLLVVPFILVPTWRNRLIYSGTFLVSAFISIIPILGKFSEFRRFISGVVSHDGLYGQGASQMINWGDFGKNILLIFKYNPAYTIILAISLLLIIYLLANPLRRRLKSTELLFLGGFLAASLLGFLIVAKHFKNYYFGPVLAQSGFILVLIMKQDIFKKLTELGKLRELKGIVSYAVTGLLIIITVIPLIPDYQLRQERNRKDQLTADFLHRNSGPGNILFVEPTWMAGPMVENALAYGISYVAHRQRLYSAFRHVYPNVITWEGEKEPLRHFRAVDADPEAILRSGKNILVLSTPGRNSSSLINKLDSLGALNGISLLKDTLYENPFNQDIVFNIHSNESWQTLSDQFLPVTKSLVLDSGTRNSPAMSLTDARPGDYLEATVLVDSRESAPGTLILRSLESDRDGVYFSDSQSFFEAGRHLRLLRLRARISQAPAGGRMVCHFYYPGNTRVEISDFQIKHFGQR